MIHIRYCRSHTTCINIQWNQGDLYDEIIITMVLSSTRKNITRLLPLVLHTHSNAEQSHDIFWYSFVLWWYLYQNFETIFVWTEPLGSKFSATSTNKQLFILHYGIVCERLEDIFHFVIVLTHICEKSLISLKLKFNATSVNKQLSSDILRLHYGILVWCSWKTRSTGLITST